MKINNMLSFIYPFSYWKDFYKTYKNHKKLKEVLRDFFDNNDIELQKKFLENFDYPRNMTEKPVRYYEDEGFIYYVLNFKSAEMFNNPGTKEYAYVKSLQTLEENLPIGVTEYIEPLENLELEDTFSLFCSFAINKSITKEIRTYFLSILLNLGITAGIVIGILQLIKLF